VVVILCGTNDYYKTQGSASSAFTPAYPITGNATGTILDISTAIRYSCELILDSYPNCQIILTTPIQRGDADNSVMFSIGQIIKDCANQLSVSVIDVGKEVGIYGEKEVLTNTFLNADGLHPSALGNEKMGAFMARRLKNLINI
jgi:lysophospholipase L1-like esterase